MSYLSNATVHELTNALLSSGLAVPDTRDELLTGINRGYAASLPLRATILDQLRSDMVEMNGVPYLMGNEVPLKTWLENAVARLRRTYRPEQAKFQAALDEVALKSQQEVQQAQGIAPAAGVAGGVENIVHQDDMLPFGWLLGALAVSRSVARLTVPRHENGVPALAPASSNLMLYRGTGWLIGPRHVITNHHVINARSEGEPNAAEADLRLQAEKTLVQFDYDSEGVDGLPAVVDGLVAWSPWNTSPTLDFAILKLQDAPVGRRPLALAPAALAEAGQQGLPVNIIQHPGGSPKMLGVRNNLVSRLDDWYLSYYTDTLQGSSGSPVCNDRWQVVALHRAWEYANQLMFQGKPTAWRNIGVRIDRLIEHLKDKEPALWAEIAADVV
jgi:hypothetical protein